MYCPNEERIAKDIPRFMLLSSFQTSSSSSSSTSPTATTTTTATTAAATPVTELDSTSPKKANKLAWLDQQTAMSNATISPLAKEFREKIESFLEFQQEEEEELGHGGGGGSTTTTTTTSWFVIPNHRLRALYEGVVASAQEPPVYKSFEILFQDLLPLRVAGRMIFRRLYQTLRTQYLQPQQDENQQILQQILPPSPRPKEQEQQDTLRNEIQKSRRLFMELVEYCNNYYHRVVVTKNGDFPLVLNKSDLIETGIATEIAIRHYGLDSETQWLEKSFPHQSIGFADFYLVLAQSNHNNHNNNDQDKDNNNKDNSSSSYTNGAFEILKSVTKHLREREPNNSNNDNHQGNNLWRNDPKKQKHVDSYQHMVQSFQEWEGIVLPEDDDDLSSSSSSSRRIQVLRGCFVGARNPRVVQALQIVYVDYQALRVAGNLIFKLMSAIVHSSGGGGGNRRKNNKKRSKQ